MILLSMSLLFFVNTNKIRNYSYIKGRIQVMKLCETIFIFIQTKEYVTCTIFDMWGKLLACPLHIPHSDHGF